MKTLTYAIGALAAVYLAVFMLTRDAHAPALAIPDDATSVLADPRFSPPAGWQWTQLDASESGPVRVGYAAPDNPRGLVVFLPGYSAPLNIYFESLSALMSDGYAVGGLDWPSQGGSARAAANAQMIPSAKAAASQATLAGVHLPVWIPVAENDTFVDNAKAAAVCQQLATCQSQQYAQARHCLFEESDPYYGPLMANLLAFLNAHNPVQPLR